MRTALAVLDRQREAREIPLLPEASRQAPADPPLGRDLDPPLVAIPWRDAVARIAAEHRLVLIMAALSVTEDRAWVEQTLGLIRAAGFSHYLAEAITESGSPLKPRGCPPTPPLRCKLPFSNSLR